MLKVLKSITIKQITIILLLGVMMIQLVGCGIYTKAEIKVSSTENQFVKSSSKVNYTIVPMKPTNLIKLVTINDETIIDDKLLYDLCKSDNFNSKKEFIVDTYKNKSNRLIKKIFTCKSIKGFKHVENF
ncbi:hypothetical protein [Clostridium estertheticum]|uniref:hypothetical protein n=1 Tax=Clostridium estertheticum TaxID=238834 RepID=UPI001C0AC214|nr:hypothetical protein [Clostridium estertheticum]MBU3173353.1 hypothetical protein [Clostridium estertheticum]